MSACSGRLSAAVVCFLPSMVSVRKRPTGRLANAVASTRLQAYDGGQGHGRFVIYGFAFAGGVACEGAPEVDRGFSRLLRPPLRKVAPRSCCRL